MEANERQLFALMATDAVAGELENSVLGVDSPEQLFDIRRIVIEADTTTGTIKESARLETMIDRFMQEEDSWFDDELIEAMVTSAKRTGNITRNPLSLEHQAFEQKNFWTAHFGGLYLFQDADSSALIASREKPQGRFPVKRTLSLGERKKIGEFLQENQLAEPIVKVRGADEAQILRQKMTFVLAETLVNKGMDVTGLSYADVRRLAARYTDDLPPEYEGLAAMVRWAETRGARPKIGLDDPSYFYLMRATHGPDRDLVNMLLAELSPLDMRQLYICHKNEFYRQYRDWPDAKKAYCVDFLAREYVDNKAGARAYLFGDEE